MTNHPNRGSRAITATGLLKPSPAALKDLRKRAGLTQAVCAELVHASLRTWEQWEAGDRAMPSAAMELWCLAVAVGSVQSGPYLAPGEWMTTFVRPELRAFFRRRFTDR